MPWQLFMDFLSQKPAPSRESFLSFPGSSLGTLELEALPPLSWLTKSILRAEPARHGFPGRAWEPEENARARFN